MRRRYGRVHVPDSRDFDYLIKRRRSARVSRTWALGPQLDQKSTPECVAFALAAMLLGDPIKQFVNPHGLYEYAKFADEYAGENYDGTSVRAGAKVLAALGFIDKYKWAFSVDTMIGTVLEVCPMVVGTNWYAGMNKPDADGLMTPKGRLLGGHAWYIYGANTQTELFNVRGSYGVAWAKRGNATISFDSMARLLKEDGESLIATEATPTVK